MCLSALPSTYVQANKCLLLLPRHHVALVYYGHLDKRVCFWDQTSLHILLSIVFSWIKIIAYACMSRRSRNCYFIWRMHLWRDVTRFAFRSIFWDSFYGSSETYTSDGMLWLHNVIEIKQQVNLSSKKTERLRGYWQKENKSWCCEIRWQNRSWLVTNNILMDMC